jgi:nicotinamide phosphoribosyltransferase
MKIRPTNLKDGYKTDHRRQYPENTSLVYSNLTARASRDPRYTHVVPFGFQAFVQELKDNFDKEFFQLPKSQAVSAYKRRLDTYLGPGAVPVDHIEALHDLGYLPLHIKALPEGSLCPIGVPMFTIVNTNKNFYWLTNDLETLISTETWKPITNATIAFEYRKVLQGACMRTNPEMIEFVPWQGHDFSFRGMDGVSSAARSGAAHLLSFTGTDTIPAIDFLEQYYCADAEKELIGGSVPATEHSVMCMGGQETELETFKRLINDVYPSGIVSIVSDTWDYWDTLTNKAALLKNDIMARNGKVVFRPDSGDPVKIVCGDPDAPVGSPQHKGSIQVLWDLFGGTTTSTGYKQLDSHVGLIYGDSITLERAEAIVNGLAAKGFASTNVVFGIGSFTYQYNTRDTFGMAIKATYGRIGDAPVDLFKNPKTDSGMKKSAKGLLRVNADFSLSQQVTPEEEKQGLLQTIFLDGNFENVQTLAQIRARLLSNLNAK